MTLDSDTSVIKGVGPELRKLLLKLQIHSVRDLVENLPRKFHDYSNITSIKDARPGPITIKATIKQATGRYVRRGLHITEAVASDDTGSVRLIWFNQPYRSISLKPNSDYYLSGEFGLQHKHMSIQNPSTELVSDFPVNTARIIPVYKETKGLKSSQLRKLLKEVSPLIRDLDETLPDWLIQKDKFISRSKAYEIMHFPTSLDEFSQAKRRLAFEEVFRLSLAALLNKQEVLSESALSIPFNEKLAKKFVNELAFKLTDDQRKAVWQIYKDLAKKHPMNRLIEGDVGSGKTVVAAMAAIMAIKQKFQVAMMAPTEILAKQHAETLSLLLQPLGMAQTIVLLTGSLKSKTKSIVYQKVSEGNANFIVGTNALIQQKLNMHNLGLIIIDEQHRFGVEQRKKLQAKAGHMPHVLSMTATPIPRSLALTLYGELDISILNQKPVGRKSIITKLISPNSREQMYKKMEDQLDEGHQIYVVCPLITETKTTLNQSVEYVYKELSQKIFKHRSVGLLHGKLSARDKEKVMERFKNKQIEILVSTTVIEVGVDVPNASMIVVESADRYGLAQIHQLRGRIGRGNQQGYCYLVLSDSRQPSVRLRALESIQDGFKLAEIDLEIRGPGAIYGTIQHGALDLRIAKLTDVKLISLARKRAQEFIDSKENLLEYPELHEQIKRLQAVTNLN